MDTSIFSLLIRCLYCSALILILCGCCRSGRLLKRLGPAFMMTAFAACIVRMMVPFHVIWIYHPAFYRLADRFRLFLEKPLQSGGFVTVEQLVGFLWLAVFLVLLFQKGAGCVRLLQKVSRMPQAKWETLFEENGLDSEQFAALAECRLVRTARISYPCLVGFFQPCLLLPDRAYEKEQLWYILLHEQLHVKNKDILWKVGMDLLSICFWWDPVFHLLRREYFSMIEMKADMEIAGLCSQKDTVSYMECLKNTAVQLSGGGPAFEISFSGSRFGELKRRMELLADAAFCRWQQFLAALSLAAVLAASSSYLLPPYHYAMLYGRTPVTPYTTCLVKNGETYDVYMNGRYVRRIKDPEYFARVPVYENMEAYLQDHQDDAGEKAGEN